MKTSGKDGIELLRECSKAYVFRHAEVQPFGGALHTHSKRQSDGEYDMRVEAFGVTQG
jgi:hypothetical protein